MNKRVLIISPYFPPVNAADMQRVRMSLLYFKDLGWDAEVVTVHPQFSDFSEDELLLKTIPHQIKIHYVRALSKKLTSKLGLGSIALRSLWFYKSTVDKVLRSQHFDLIYFSTTQFPVCILGAHWQKKFKIPYVIDMQDPWHSDYYRNKPKNQRPPKYWLSYRLNKYLEPIAMKRVAGLISVSPAYIHQLQQRYPHLNKQPAAVIPFGAFEPDLVIAQQNQQQFAALINQRFINLVYVGRGGTDMHAAIRPIFAALAKAMDKQQAMQQIRLHFIGTSYAPAGTGKASILPLAEQYGISSYVHEHTDRISYYHALVTLLQADALFIPGSDDSKYTASKLYPYLLSQKPILSVFHPDSPALAVLNDFGVEHSFNFNTLTEQNVIDFFDLLVHKKLAPPDYPAWAITKYAARQMTQMQCNLFEQVLAAQNKPINN